MVYTPELKPGSGESGKPKAEALAYLEANTQILSKLRMASQTKARTDNGLTAGVSPLRRQSAPPPVEMTTVVGVDGRTGNGKGRTQSTLGKSRKGRKGVTRGSE